MEMSGFHHNVVGGFLRLKLGIYAARRGAVVLRDFRYRALRWVRPAARSGRANGGARGDPAVRPKATDNA